MAKKILVTGAGGGIGGALAARLAARGDTVYAVGLTLADMDGLTAPNITKIAMDVGDTASVQAGFATLGRLDAVVHCAAIAPVGTVEFTPAEEVARVLNINTLGSLRVLQAALPLLRKSGDGRLVLLSSLWGRVSGPFVSSYAASKAALEALADAARRETKGRGVKISMIEPGVMRTAMYYSQVDQLDRKVAEIGADERAIYGALYADHRKLVANGGKNAITPDQCCAIIEKCLAAANPRPRYRAGNDAKAIVLMGRLLSSRALDGVFGMLYPAKG